MGQTTSGAESCWREHVEAWRTSGQSRADYCATHELSRKTFGWWAWHFDRERRSAAASPSPSFLPVEVADGAGLVAGPTAASQERIEIALPDGVLVRVGAGFDAAALRRVLAVLGP